MPAPLFCLVTWRMPATGRCGFTYCESAGMSGVSLQVDPASAESIAGGWHANRETLRDLDVDPVGRTPGRKAITVSRYSTAARGGRMTKRTEVPSGTIATAMRFSPIATERLGWNATRPVALLRCGARPRSWNAARVVLTEIRLGKTGRPIDRRDFGALFGAHVSCEFVPTFVNEESVRVRYRLAGLDTMDRNRQR